MRSPFRGQRRRRRRQVRAVVSGGAAASGMRRVKVEPRPSSLHTRHRAAVVARDVLDDGQAQAGAAGAAGPRLVDPVEALEHPLAVLARDADAAVGDGDLGEARPRAGGDGDARLPRAVGDRVGQQVGDGGGQLALHAADDEALLPADGDVELLGAGGGAGAVDGLGQHAGRPAPAPARAAARRPAAGTGRSARGPAGRAGRPRAAMRAAKRCTASGSSAAPSIASASSDSAPTGVFSSWPTLATKSRRTASMRRASVTSSSTRATGPGGGAVPLSSRTPCTPIIRGPAPTRLPGSRTSARRLPAAADRLRQLEQLGHEQPGAAHDAERAGGRVGQQHGVVGVDDEHGRVHQVEQPAGHRRLGQR